MIPTQNFIEQAIILHNGKYDYSDYIDYQQMNPDELLKLFCPSHQRFFFVSLTSHLSGQGCFSCCSRPRLTTKEFIERAIALHGDTYDYSKVEYINSRTKVLIICRIHGAFKQKAGGHLCGDGCHKCGHLRRTELAKLSKEEFIRKAREIHGDTYDYENVDYVMNDDYVLITCKIHGDWPQRPRVHLAGSGCDKCTGSVSKLEIEWLDSLEIPKGYRQQNIHVDESSTLSVDAYDPITNTVYEFYGDYWHGNPNRYKASQSNKLNGKTYGELFQRTIERETLIKSAGYKLITIWESDWKQRKKQSLSVDLGNSR